MEITCGETVTQCERPATLQVNSALIPARRGRWWFRRCATATAVSGSTWHHRTIRLTQAEWVSHRVAVPGRGRPM